MERVSTALETARGLMTRGAQLLHESMDAHSARVKAGEKIEPREVDALTRLALAYSREANRLASLELRVQQAMARQAAPEKALASATARVARRTESLAALLPLMTTPDALRAVSPPASAPAETRAPAAEAPRLPVSKAEFRQAMAEAVAFGKQLDASDPGATAPLPKRVRRVLRKLGWQYSDIREVLGRLSAFAAQVA